MMFVARCVRRQARMYAVLTAVIGSLVLAGCTVGARRSAPPASPEPDRQAAAAPATRSAVPTTAADDPIRLLQDSLAKAKSLEGYRVIFHRQERRGLGNRLQDWERIDVHYRRDPKAVKMVWLDEDSEYEQMFYVEGVGDDKVTVLARKGLLGLPASPLQVPPEAAVQWGKSLRPVTDFGLAEMLRRTLAHIEQAREYGGASVTYEGVTMVEPLATEAHRVTVRYPKGFTRAARQDVYINTRTGLPDGTHIWLPNGDLLAAYFYENPQSGVPAGEVFQITRTAKR